MSGPRITIDPVACSAYGYCSEILPEAITLDEWGYPIIDDRPIPAELMSLARRAVRDCPKQAITIREKKSS
jgi:ferredoxin